MTWHLCAWTFQLKSPLHIGFHKIMHLFRTRPYVPSRVIWGALTSKVTPILGINDYQKVGTFLKKAMRFGYLYPCVEDKFFFPKYTEKCLMFGSLSQNEFDKKFVSSMASASIDSDSMSAEEGMLHEVEFINPYTIDEGKPVFLKGLVWIRKIAENKLSITTQSNNFSINHNGVDIDFMNKPVELQIGGERKYGFGLMELKEIKEINNNKLELFAGEWFEKNDEINLSLTEGDAIFSHLKFDNINIKGNIEPLVGRDWDTVSNKGSGRKLSNLGLCWSPGSILNERKIFKVNELGLWEKAS